MKFLKIFLTFSTFFLLVFCVSNHAIYGQTNNTAVSMDLKQNIQLQTGSDQIKGTIYDDNEKGRLPKHSL